MQCGGQMKQGGDLGPMSGPPLLVSNVARWDCPILPMIPMKLWLVSDGMHDRTPRIIWLGSERINGYHPSEDMYSVHMGESPHSSPQTLGIGRSLANGTCWQHVGNK